MWTEQPLHMRHDKSSLLESYPDVFDHTALFPVLFNKLRLGEAELEFKQTAQWVCAGNCHP